MDEELSQPNQNNQEQPNKTLSDLLNKGHLADLEKAESLNATEKMTEALTLIAQEIYQDHTLIRPYFKLLRQLGVKPGSRERGMNVIRSRMKKLEDSLPIFEEILALSKQSNEDLDISNERLKIRQAILERRIKNIRRIFPFWRRRLKELSD